MPKEYFSYNAMCRAFVHCIVGSKCAELFLLIQSFGFSKPRFCQSGSSVRGLGLEPTKTHDAVMCVESRGSTAF